MQTYRDLKTWQKAIDLVEMVYRAARPLPAEERFGLCSQAQRASVSVPANIAEGYGREHRKEYLRHLSISRGSLMELETHLIIANRLGYFRTEEYEPLWEQTQVVGRLLHRLIESLRRGLRSSEPRTLYPEPGDCAPGSRFEFPSEEGPTGE